MSRNNAKLALIVDLQCMESDATLTKRDLQFLITGLQSIDKSSFTMRKKTEVESLLQYLRRIAYSKH